MLCLLFIALVVSTCRAHFTMQWVWVNGVDQGHNTAIRVPPTFDPVENVTSTNVTCNYKGLSGANVKILEIPTASNITFQWHQHAIRTGEDAILSGHHGPVQVYIAKAPSNVATFDGQGNVWTKIYSAGILNAPSEPEQQFWATDAVNATNGQHSVVLPESLPAGEYLLRPEIIALHRASKYPGAQIYTACVQVKITSGGDATPPTVSLPGAYKSTDPGITTNIWTTVTNYTAPGGPVWSG